MAPVRGDPRGAAPGFVPRGNRALRDLGRTPPDASAFSHLARGQTAVEVDDSRNGDGEEAPISAFYARASDVMEEDREVLDGLDE